ncbi:hypothetical protein [Streptomyces palmae]|uniref:Uncharacterized protein n=1 Tax=Streptomyces palmae TaxID=1701085 RepID=A0A4Z0FRT1_9ACTN|nr:hypothetical protein [Streptomyces palmae]TGA85305.1 hypothetical protein E4099_30995 [Streptomyces palmae]
MTPWNPPPTPAPWGGPGPVPAPWGGPQPLEIRIELVQPEPEQPGFWRRLWNLLARGISPYAAWGALAAAVIPIPGVGYGAGAIWGSLLFQLEVWTNDVAPGFVPGLVGLGTLMFAFRAFMVRPGAVRFFFLATAAIGTITGVLWPDVVAAMTGVRA